MAYRAENPVLGETGVWGVNALIRNVTSLFGPRAHQLMDPSFFMKHTRYGLPHSLLNDTRYLTTTFLTALDQIAGWWRDVTGPVQNESSQNIVVPVWVQRLVIAQYTAPGAPADLSQQTQEDQAFSLMRIQTDFEFDNENFQFGGADGTREVELKLGGVSAAVQLAYERRIIEQLFLIKDKYSLYKARYGHRSVRTVQEAMRWSTDSTFIFQKEGMRGWIHMLAFMKNAITSGGGAAPNLLLVSTGVRLEATRAVDAVRFLESGRFVYRNLENPSSAMNELQGIRIVEISPVVVDNETDPVDPLLVRLRTGNYFTLPSTMPNANLPDYKTYKRNVLVYDADKDNAQTRVTLQDVMPYLQRWDSNGHLLGYHYDLAANLRQNMLDMNFAVPEDTNENIQPDMFLYRHETGGYRVATIFGHMENFYLDINDLVELVETGYNSFREPLTEYDKRALAEAQKLMDDLNTYDVLSPAAQVFRRALRLSNVGAEANGEVNPTTGNVQRGLWGFAARMPRVVQEGGSFLMRAADDGDFISFEANTVGTQATATGAYRQDVRFRPFGMGSVPGLMTLAELARAPAGSPERLGYDDGMLDTARDAAIAIRKIWEVMVNHFGMEHISLNPENVPEFFRSPVPEHNSIILFAQQHLFKPVYPFYEPYDVETQTEISEEERAVEAGLRDAISRVGSRLRDTEAIDFLLGFLEEDRSFALLLDKIPELFNGVTGRTWFEEALENKTPSAQVKALNLLVKRLKEAGVACVGLTDDRHISLGLVADRTQFFRNEVWTAGLVPRSVECPHGVFRDRTGAVGVTAFRNSGRNARNVQAGDVLATYVVSDEKQPYEPGEFSNGMDRDLDLEFDLLTQTNGPADGTEDQQRYRGDSSSNLERKYTEVSNRYSSMPVHRAYGQMVLLAMTTYHQYMRFAENQVIWPGEVLALRPQIELNAYSFIFMRGDGETVTLHRNAPNFLFENRGVARKTVASYAEYFEAVVRDVGAYATLPAGWSGGYIRGEGLDPLTLHNMDVESGDYGGSVLYVLMPPRATQGRPGLRTKVEAVQFFTGRLDETYWNTTVAQDLASAGLQWGTRTQPSAVYTAFVNRTYTVANKMRASELTHLPSDPPPANNAMRRAQSWLWNEGQGGYCTKIEAEDVYGRDGTYSGRRNDLDGKLFRCVQPPNSCTPVNLAPACAG